MDERLNNIFEALEEIELDADVPKNVRATIKDVTSALAEVNKSLALRIDKSLQKLDEASSDPNVPMHARTQIWNIVSILESIQ
ncbi:UPF0147 family protein [Candidatus Woesearchaeota archaeon]|nr:UPF0147 family protein [Candidatus Woesearchaeota archaeon]